MSKKKRSLVAGIIVGVKMFGAGILGGLIAGVIMFIPSVLGIVVTDNVSVLAALTPITMGLGLIFGGIIAHYLWGWK